MDSPTLLEQHVIFILKARQDFSLVREVMDNAKVAPEIMLFHLQQGVEKLIKALFCLHSVRFPKTHDLDELAELARDRGIDLPFDMEKLTELTPYAVEWRYAVLHDDLHDIAVMLHQAESFLEFVESYAQSRG